MRRISILAVVLLAFELGSCSDSVRPITAPDVTRAVLATEGYDLGFTHYDCIYNISSDSDSDGLDDTCELQLATAFNPQLVVHTDDDVSREPAFAVRESGGTVSILYMASYHRDLGSIDWLGFESVIPYIKKLGPHSGDSEFVNVKVTESGGVWKLQNVFMSAHWNVPEFCVIETTSTACVTFDESRGYVPSELTFADVYRGRPKVWVAKDKHANYPSYSACNDHFDTCTSGTYTTNLLNDTTRNVGSGSTQLIDSIASKTPSYYTGVEAYWTETDRFDGWYGSGWGEGAGPYHIALGYFGFDSGWTSPNLTVGISGPTWVRSYNNCNWVVTVSGGTPPYQYRWFRGDSLVSTAQNYAGNTGDTDFLLNLHIIDRYGFRDASYVGIGQDQNADPCVER